MIEDREYEEAYCKGANEGYWLARYLPELAAKLTEIKNDTPRLDGLLDGIQLYAFDLARDLEPPWRQDETRENTPPGKGIEPER